MTVDFGGAAASSAFSPAPDLSSDCSFGTWPESPSQATLTLPRGAGYVRERILHSFRNVLPCTSPKVDIPMARILIVDDAASTLTGLCELLENAGYEVVGAASFEEGRRLADQATPDLLVVDVRLGAYNGLHLVIRERLAHPERPIILTTGFPDSVLEAEARGYGVQVLEKPIQSSELIATIQKLLPDVQQVAAR